MLCPNCQNENRDGAKFCDECGFPLKTAGAGDAGYSPSAKTEVIEEPLGDVPDALYEPEPGEYAPVKDSNAAETQLIEHPAHAPSQELVTEVLQDPVMKPASFEENRSNANERFSSAPVAAGPDFAGFDRTSDDFEEERLVDSSYRPPDPSFRDGSTMQMPRMETDEPPKSKEYRATNTAQRKGRGKLAFGIIAAVVVAVAVAVFATYQMQVWGGKVVPDVTGMTEVDARSVLLDQGFDVRSEQLKSDDTEGLVLLTDPIAGSRVDAGSEVVINIATARTIPKVVGKTKEEAEKLLSEAGYENVRFLEKSSDKTKGTVLSVKPKAGERAKSTAQVTVKVATPYVVPNVAGKYLTDAIAEIEAAGLGYEAVYYDTDEVPEGMVVNTEPAAGSEVYKGAYIVINVAQARGTVLEEAAEEYLAEGNTVSINGTDYMIESLDSVNYIGGDTVSYTVTARPFIIFFGEMLKPSNSETLSGTIVFSSNNDVVALS